MNRLIGIFATVAALVVLAGCGGNNTYSPALQGGGGPTPTFALSAASPSSNVTVGNSVTYTVTGTSSNGFSSPVSLSVSGLPAGAAGTFSPTSITPTSSGASSTLTVNTASGGTTGNIHGTIKSVTSRAVAPGTYTLTITGTGGGTTKTTTVQLVVQAAGSPDFAIAASPASRTITAGQSTTYTATLTASNGFSSAVNLSATGLPTGATATFNQTSVTPTSGGASSTVTIQTGSSTPAGTSTITITGTSGSTTHTATVQLIVQGAPSFALAGSPASRTITAGQSTTYTVTATSTNGFSSLVALTVTGLPTGASGSFNPASVTPTGSGVTSTLTVNTGSSTPAGTSTLTITGMGGSLTKTTTVQLVVQSSGGGGGSLLNKIVFVRDLSAADGIYSMNPDGSNVSKVPNTGTNDFDPDVSPDGTKIVFRRLNAGLFVINADGSNLTQITNDNSDQEPSWSPNGTKIAFIRLFNSSGDVMLMNANGSNVVDLTNTPIAADGAPNWSPDGTKIVYVNGTTNNIRIINTDGSNDHSLGAAGANPSWSPDGAKIAFHKLGGNFRIFVINADGTNEVQLTPGTEDDSEADWSPDGTKIVFSKNITGAGSEILVMNADGSNPVRLTNNAVNDFRPRWR